MELGKLKKLARLSLSDTANITDAGVKSLEETLPNLQVSR